MAIGKSDKRATETLTMGHVVHTAVAILVAKAAYQTKLIST